SGESVQGLRSLEDGFIPPVFEKWGGIQLLDGKRIIRPAESLEYTRVLTKESGIFCGISSGAALAGAIRTAEKIDTGKVVFVVCDGGWKYLSTGAWSGSLEQAADSIDSIIYF
ncbi:MAG: cysteine synthase B, partial [Actinomycetota bacterium]